jgi:hypothetical protein
MRAGLGIPEASWLIVVVIPLPAVQAVMAAEGL